MDEMDEDIIGTIIFSYGLPSVNNGNTPHEQPIHPWSTWEDIQRNCGVDAMFQYKDEDGDLIEGKTGAEWKSVLSSARKTDEFVVNVYVGHTNVHQKHSTTTCCNQGLLQTKRENDEAKETKCCGNDIASCKRNNPNCCPTTYPMIGQRNNDGKDYVKKANPDLKDYKYKNDSLVAVALPLGPLGGGSIAIAGDGGLRQWQIINKVNHTAHVPNSFFGMRINDSVIALQSSTHYNDKIQPAPQISDHVVPDASKKLLSQIRGVETVEVTAKCPVVEVDYMDPSFKDIDVHMEAWSPKIPLDAERSAIPVIYFDFTVTNRTGKSAEISILGSLQNIVGWGGYSILDEDEDTDKNTLYGGNQNQLYVTNLLYGLKMTHSKLPKNHQFNGEMSLFALPWKDQKKSSLLQYDSIDILWKEFSEDSQLSGQGICGVSASGHTFNGAINLTSTVAAGGSQKYTYAIAWRFPNRIKDWNVSAALPNTEVYVGNHYANIWKSIEDVVNTAATNYASTRELTFQFRDDMFNSTLPWQLIDSVAGRISVINSPSCMWHADGYFYAFEGCSSKSGCCPLNCTHVWNYEMTLAYLFPSLEQKMREIDLLVQINPYGVIPSRTNAPLELRRIWNTWPKYSTSPASTTICVDGEMGTVLKAYREIRNGAGMKWLHTIWAPIKLIMNRWLNELDSEKIGMIYGAQPNTYDVATYGYSIFIGLLYLCGLRAAAEMATLMGDSETEFHNVCMQRYHYGTVKLDKTCYNGHWYVQIPDPNHMSNLMTDASFIGVMYGQWWANSLELGYLLPQEHIRSHLSNTYKRNYVPKFDPATQKPRIFADNLDSGWVTGKWDDGKMPQNALLYSHEIAWSGVIYPFASLLLNEGFIEEGLDVLEKTRMFYDGTRRSPWNEIECGDHYTRPMSSFVLNLTSSGQKYKIDKTSGSLSVTFSPILNVEDYVGFMVLPKCWGNYSQTVTSTNANVILKLSYGTTTLSSFGVGDLPRNLIIKSVMVGKNVVDFDVVCAESYVIAKFKSLLPLKGGDELVINYATE